MDATCELAARVLTRAPSRSMPVSRLRLLMEAESGTPHDYEHVLRCLSARPARFRMLDPWRGPWRTCEPRPPRFAPTDSDALISNGPWVLLLDPPQEVGLDPPVRRLQESLAAAGRGVDTDSATAMARWVRITLEGERAVSMLHHRKAP